MALPWRRAAISATNVVINPPSVATNAAGKGPNSIRAAKVIADDMEKEILGRITWLVVNSDRITRPPKSTKAGGKGAMRIRDQTTRAIPSPDTQAM
jgi:hypothetical protein